MFASRSATTALALGLWVCLAAPGTAQAQDEARPRGDRDESQPPLQFRRFQGRPLDPEQMERMNEAMRQLQSMQRRFPGQVREMPLDRLAELYQQAGPDRFVDVFRFDSPAMARLGLVLRPVPEVLRSHLDLPESGGMVVDVVAEDGPSAGVIEVNDILLKIGETAINEVADVEKALEATEGDELSVTVMRRGEEQTVTIERAGPARPEEPQTEEAFRLGIVINEPDDAIRAQLGLEEGQGVIVMEVAPESAAEKAGIKPNDVLISLDGEPIAGVTELAELVQASGGEPISLKLLRDGEETTIEATPETVSVAPATPEGPRGSRPPFEMRFFGPGVMIDPETGAIRPGPGPGFGRPRLPNPPRESRDAPIAPELERQLNELTEQLKQLREEVERLRQARPERPGRPGRRGPEGA
ncbi:PDZ domain-containing protein [Tautonia sp. JC769]|uniref:PDZ domain-containing protein n=1 Tax=Tautonia sp. JC769 TaxID=3232135 RepID=UPI00345B1180